MEKKGTAVVVTCFDSRYNSAWRHWLRSQYGLGESEYILLGTEGAELTAHSLEHSIHKAKELKGLSKIILVSHLGCLYREAENLDDDLETHKADMRPMVLGWQQKFGCMVESVLAPAPDADNVVPSLGWKPLDLSNVREPAQASA